jgi:signal transduction histidine kinase
MKLRISRRTHLHWLPGGRERLDLKQAMAAAEDRHREAMRKMAHDLRNPLNSILLMAQLLEEVGGTPDSERIAKRILRQCDEMNKMVNRAMAEVPG